MTTPQRQHPRFAVRLAVEVELDGHTVAGATRNVSAGGAALVLDRPLAEGSSVRITLLLTQDGIEAPDEEPLGARAVVAWIASQDEHEHVAGVRFAELPASDRIRLERFLTLLVD